MPSLEDAEPADPGSSLPGQVGAPLAGATVVGATAIGSGLVEDAAVALDEIYRALDAFEEQARGRGDSTRAVHQVRHRLARQLGHTATAEQEFELWLAAPRDLSSGCFVCERSQMGDWYAERGEDARALEAWEEILDGSVFCDAEPHGVLARSLIPLIRLGKGTQAQANHVEGYRISRLKPSMCAEIGAHIEFCALTGNTARGLELLAEHGHWLTDRGAAGRVDGDQEAAGRNATERRAAFLGGVSVLLRVLTISGLDDLPFAIIGGATKPIGELRDEVDEELSSIAARFDERNGTSAVSSRIVHRRSRQPFLSALALDARTVLPATSARGGRRAAVQAPRRKPRPVEDLITEARRLTELWHPDALDAWRRAQAAAKATGRPLPADAQTEFDEQAVLADGTATGINDGVAAAVQRARLLEIAERYRSQGRAGLSLRASSRAAFALLRSGQQDAAASDQAALRLAAADALAGHEITPSEYLAVRIGSGYQKFHIWKSLATAQPGEHAGRGEDTDDRPAPSPWFGGKPRTDTGPGESGGGGGGTPPSPEPDKDRAAALAAAARDALAELHELAEECRRFEVALYGAAAAGMTAQVRLGGGEAEAAEQSLRRSTELYHEGGAPWCATAAELNLGRIACARGELPAAERYARAAVEHNLDPALRGSAAMLLAEAIWLQDGRESEAVAPALAAAAAFARQDGRGDEETRAHLLAAEALSVAGRPEEAIALFEPALKTAQARWDQDEWKPLIAQAARAYGNSLMAAGDPRRAAELLLSTADRVKAWPNQVPHAMLAADAATALERAGRPADAAAAFERAAQLWQQVGEPLVRVKCLRSAAWLLAAEDLDAALGVMDRAGGELITVLAADDGSDARHGPARYELAETHLQRARIVLNLAENRSLAADESEKLLGEAYQHANAAISGLRRLVPAGPESETAPGPRPAPDGLLFERLAVALMAAARIEGGHLDRAPAAAAKLRDRAVEFESWDKPELARRLTERAEQLHPGAAVLPLFATAPAAPCAPHLSLRYSTVA
ncbi:MAG TPA: hypothetical protein VFU74_03765 [Actinocrinis sp.]|nr:hypothetical protein [Actinocrinis sp.]